jgi:ABC-2 type transport system permease protein
MKKIWLVAKREYRFTVRRKGFIISTLGMPLLFVLAYGISGGAVLLSMRQSRVKVDNIGIVDESGLLQASLLTQVQKSLAPSPAPTGLPGRAAAAALGGGEVSLHSFDTPEAARDAFLRQEIRGYYVVPRDYLQSGAVQLQIKKGGVMTDNEPGWILLRRWLAASLVAGKLPEETAQRLWLPPTLDSNPLKADGSPDKAGALGGITSFGVPYVFAVLFMISLMMSSGFLLQGVAEEKENRVIEILLSSVTHNELLAGKVLGLCAAGLTQLGVWIVMVVTPAIFFIPGIDLRWSQLFIALLFFVLGFMMFGTLMAGLGSLGNNARESQQIAMVATMSSVIPMILLMPILNQPNGTLARVLSYIPLTAPVTIMMRIGAVRVPWWDILLSAAILCASLLLFLRLGAKLFRLGTLMYGKRPSAVEIVRWLREA